MLELIQIRCCTYHAVLTSTVPIYLMNYLFIYFTPGEFLFILHYPTQASLSPQHFLCSLGVNHSLPSPQYHCALVTPRNYVCLMCLFRRRQWHPAPVLLPGKSRGWRSLVGCSPWGREESDTTERLHFHFSLSCTGEGNGNPLQCSCLETPRDGEAWWAAISGVAQSQTRLKRLSSSSNVSI